MAKIILECQIDSISTKVDGTMSVRIGSQEIDQVAAASLFGFRGKHCKVLISDSNITTLEAETVDATSLVKGEKNKTKSQRLRNALFVLHGQLQPAGMDFDTFYDLQMEDIINAVKSKLE